MAARGAARGPLHCIPVIVKDNFETHHLQTTAGSLSLKGWVPTRDATMVALVSGTIVCWCTFASIVYNLPKLHSLPLMVVYGSCPPSSISPRISLLR